jgi:proteic killer suppression protein
MIKNFSHKGLRDFFLAGSKKGINADHAKRLRLLLVRLHTSTSADDMDLPGFKLHALRGDREGYYSVAVSGNWRLVFRFQGTEAVDVDYLDYH